MSGPQKKPQQKLTAQHFVEWVYETYRGQLRLAELEGSQQYHDFIESMDIETFALSGGVRVQSFHIVKFGYPMRRAGYLTAAFAARIAGHETYYAYAYWPRSSRAPAPEYICLSPTFESRDGEYRHRFLWFKIFDEGYAANAPLLSRLEECLLEAVGGGELALDAYFFPGDAEGPLTAARRRAVAYAESSRLSLRALAAALAIDASDAHTDMLQTHASPAYAEVMRALYERCLPAVATIAQAAIHGALSVFVTGLAGQLERTQCGQKLVPLTVREALQVGDINYAPWREAWVGRRATDLVVNGVAPMFPIYNNWTYLDGVGRDLFEGRAMRARYDRSLQAEGVAKSLREARARARREAGGDYRMGQLDAHVYDAIAYAQEFVQLTSLALCATSEYVGRTVRSSPEVARRASWVSPALLRMYGDPAMQARYLFDLCYGAHALHTRVGAIHADLHLNNVTVFPLNAQYVVSLDPEAGAHFKTRCRNPAIAYVAGPRGEADTYVFPHDDWFACLIDFSRAILGPAARPAIVAESGEAFAAGFYRSQVSRALRVLHFYVPSYVEAHQEAIKGLLLADFGALFRVMTAVDFLAIGRNYGALLAELASEGRRPQDARALEVAPEGAKLAAQIERLALEHLVVHLTDLVEGGGGRREIAHAGDVVIPGAFDAFRFSAWAAEASAAGAPRPFALDAATLVDAYNGAAPLEYSGSDYARFPPWARFDALEPHFGVVDLDDVTADRGERPFLRSRGLDGYLAVLQERVRRTADVAPAAATSSWIAD